MAESDAHPTWQQVTKLAFSIIAVVGIVIVPHLPLTIVRPNIAPPIENHFVSAQNVDARLWQDPFEAVDAERARVRVPAPTSVQGSAISALDAERRSVSLMQREIAAMARPPAAPPVVLLAFVPGGPYLENAESRRRARYATLAGLRASGLTPIDPEHVGYFETSVEARRAGLPGLVIYERLRSTPAEDRLRLDGVVLLWLDERIFGNATVHKAATLLNELGICDAMGRRTLAAPVFILGPAESGSVRNLVEDVGHVSPRDAGCVAPMHVLSTATLPDEYVIPLPIWQAMGGRSLDQWLAGSGLRFTRMLPTDDKLVLELYAELKARGTDLRNRTTRVAIVSEWDTLYGRRIVESLSSLICGTHRLPSVLDFSPSPSASTWCDGRVQLFEYQRGLDGVLPVRDAKKASDRDDKSTEQGLRKNADSVERAEGTSQMDYLRRLAIEIDRAVTADEKSRVVGVGRVVGVLGSDVYDKLLILQALKPHHPGATFFTFNLDVRMLHRDEFNWARNTVVIAPLGLRLRPELQGSMPPFRDTFQTASFLSARVAIAQVTEAFPSTIGPVKTNALDVLAQDYWLPGQFRTAFRAGWTPRVFEIGRGKEFDLSLAGESGKCASAIDCADVTPKPPSTRVVLSKSEWPWVAVLGLVSFTLFVFSSGTRYALGQSLQGWPGRLAWAVVLAFAGAIAFFARDGAWWFEDVRPEPFSWDGGVSMWPTEMLRAFASTLGIVFWLIAVGTVRTAATAMSLGSRQMTPTLRQRAAPRRALAPGGAEFGMSSP